MTDREKKLTFLLATSPHLCLAKNCTYIGAAKDLIANGVTFGEDRNVGDKWIPVTERLPEEPLETVLVSNGKSVCVGVYSVVYDQFGVMCGRSRKAGKSFGVTHWMPLPEPPKEDK